MDNIITLVIIGVYTLVYIIVFFIQKAQIDRAKEMNNSMKSFMEIFKVEEVKKYVELRHESSLLEARNYANNMIFDSAEIKQLIDKLLLDKVDEISEVYAKSKGKEFLQMAETLLDYLRNMNKEDREKFIAEKLDRCGHFLIPIINDPRFEDPTYIPNFRE